MNTQECVVLHLNAGNDNNGNPRRLFLVMHPIEGMIGAIDEGYCGIDALKETWGEQGRELEKRIVGQLDISVKEYKRLLKTVWSPHRLYKGNKKND